MNYVRLHGLLFSSDTELLSIMNHILNGFSIETEVCTDYTPALDAVTHRGLDMVVVDWKPTNYPTRVVSAARLSSPNANSTILAMVNGRSEAQAALLSGANFILHKPADLDHARRCVKAAYGTMLQQRRRSARCPVDIPVEPVVAEIGQIEARITDISIGGLALRCKVSLEIGWTVRVCFILPGTDAGIQVKGRVVNADKNGRAGLSFSALPEQEIGRLVDWLARMLPMLENAELPSGDFVYGSGTD
jgi:CheY-like chemotaxis protein